MNNKLKLCLALSIIVVVTSIFYLILINVGKLLFYMAFHEEYYTVDFNNTQISDEDYNRVLNILGTDNVEIVKISCTDGIRENSGDYYIFFKISSNSIELTKRDTNTELYKLNINGEAQMYVLRQRIFQSTYKDENFKTMREICKKYYDKWKRNDIYIEEENWERVYV